ncbi:LuxR C-terminal-related transcriptional regulator [Streptomyces sp. SCSIO 30461]|uniref:helix-turn-helix transcriptional regulator n=1 Tax=Streptomyces sp. SCSIO 30461 TaxID=3118085 RepID=UPI0030CD3EE9
MAIARNQGRPSAHCASGQGGTVNESRETTHEVESLSLSDEDVQLYWQIRRADDGVRADDPRLETLRRVGIVFTEPLTGRPSARHLRQVERELLGRELDELEERLRHLRQIPQLLDTLDPTAVNAPATTSGIEIVTGTAAAHHVLHAAIENSTEVWSSQTQPRHAERMAASTVRDVAILEKNRGTVRYRNLYPTGARTRDPETAYARATAETGFSESRTASRRFPRMIVTDTLGMISDRRVGEGSGEPAIVIRDPALLAWLRDEFELHWEGSDRWFPVPAGAPTDRELIERDILQMLCEGHTRDAISRTLEISRRTYSTYMTDLRNRFQAKTNEQLTYELGRQRGPYGVPHQSP